MKNKIFTHEICVCEYLIQTRYVHLLCATQKTCAEMKVHMEVLDIGKDIRRLIL